MAAATRIRWYPPLDQVKGRESEIALPGPLPLADLLHLLCDDEPGLARFVQVDAQTNAVLGRMVLRGDTLLRLSDTVEPGTPLEILAAIDGG